MVYSCHRKRGRFLFERKYLSKVPSKGGGKTQKKFLVEKFGKDSLSEIFHGQMVVFFFYERMLRAAIGEREREREVIHSDENAVSMIVIENPIK